MLWSMGLVFGLFDCCCSVRTSHLFWTGAGGYADNNLGAVSTTGHGESILKVNLARLALFHIEQGM